MTGSDYTDKILTVFLTIFNGVNIFSTLRQKNKQDE